MAGWQQYPDDPVLFVVISVGSLVVGWCWWRFVGTGPVEGLLGVVTGRRKPLRVR